MCAVAVTMAIHEIKDQLSRVIAQLAETGEDVEITKHGRVVARLVLPRSGAVVLGLGVRPEGGTPDVEDLQWSEEDLREMFGGSTFPA